MEKSTSSRILGKIKTDMKINEFIALLVSSFKTFTKKWYLSILNMAVDMVFIVALTFSAVFIQFKATDHLVQLMQIGGELTGGLANIYNETDTVSAGMLAMQKNALVQYHLRHVVLYLFLLVAVAFLIWIIFQSISWYLSYRLANDKEKMLSFKQYFKNFLIQSIPFYMIYVAWAVLFVVVTMRMGTTLFPAISLDSINFVFAILAIITAYFWFFCLTFTRKTPVVNVKDSFKYGVIKFPKLAKTILFILLVFVIVDLILRIEWIASDPVYILAFGLVLLLPIATYSRILLFKTRQQILPIKLVKKRFVSKNVEKK